MTIYMKVTDDKYEFPIVMADSMKELANALGVSLSAVSHGLKRYYSGSRRTCYRKVVIDD